ncbi:MAG: rhomboid family intramembrane serine protease [Solobacterium sp.]|nr:rhomboid family intramembrane serine protease [Solobacterium sp.]
MKHKIVWNSPVVLSFAAVSMIVLVINTLTGGLLTRYFSIYRTSFADPLFYVRLLTHTLGHSDFSHYANNMMLFLVLGPMLEEKYGSKTLLEIMVVVSVVTGLLHVLISPHTALLGASGLVFAFILLSSITSSKSGTIPVTLIIVGIIYITQQVWAGVTVHDNISQLTHIIGGFAGMGCGLLLRD